LAQDPLNFVGRDAMKRITLTAAALAALAALSGCMTTSPDVVQPYHAQRMSHVQDGTIISIRPVTVDGQQTGAGAVTGGVVGGIAGSSVGGRREGAVVGVIGAVAGAVIGNATPRARGPTRSSSSCAAAIAAPSFRPRAASR
jgi:outer membrane lipoprotein SlyB